MLELDGTLLIAMISFIVFAFIMNEVLYKPVIKILEERQSFINENDRSSENADSESEKLSGQKMSELSKARSAATSFVAKGSGEFKEIQKNETEEFAKIQREKLEAEKQRLYQETDSSKDKLNESALELSKIISEKIFGGGNV